MPRSASGCQPRRSPSVRCRHWTPPVASPHCWSDWRCRLEPLVLSDTAPLSALLGFVRVIVAFVPEVVNEDVPLTVKAPLCVRLPSVLTTVRLPPTLEAASCVATLLVRLALPPDPLVLSDTAPLSRLALLSAIVAFVPEVVKFEVPPTVRTPV